MVCIAGKDLPSICSQTSALMRTFTEDDRLHILKEANIGSTEISAEAMVALKADIGVPWIKLKTMARYIR